MQGASLRLQTYRHLEGSCMHMRSAPVEGQGLFGGLDALHHQQPAGPFQRSRASDRCSIIAQLPADIELVVGAV